MSWQVAQANVALLKEPIGSELLADFVAALEPINALADSSPGFLWRLQTEDGDSTAIRVFDDDRIIVNMSVGESIEHLAHFVYDTAHLEVMRGWRRWFEQIFERPVEGPMLDALWVLFAPQSYRLLVHEAGQSRAEYQRCIKEATLRILGEDLSALDPTP